MLIKMLDISFIDFYFEKGPKAILIQLEAKEK